MIKTRKGRRKQDKEKKEENMYKKHTKKRTLWKHKREIGKKTSSICPFFLWKLWKRCVSCPLTCSVFSFFECLSSISHVFDTFALFYVVIREWRTPWKPQKESYEMTNGIGIIPFLIALHFIKNFILTHSELFVSLITFLFFLLFQ